MKNALDRMIQLAEKWAVADKSQPTAIPFLAVIHRSQPTEVTRAVLSPSFCLVLRGTKRIHLGKDVITYRAGDFLASILDIPAAGHVVSATRANPYLGLRLDLSTKEIAELVSESGIRPQLPAEPSAAAFVGKSDEYLLPLFEKLLQLLETPASAPFLSALIKKELLYRLLTGPYAHMFLQRSLFDQNSQGVGKVVAWIKNNYTQPFTVETLARENGMSVSGLHHKFKMITTMSPLQYQKQLRLQEARRLLLSGGRDVTGVALQVGYESPSQFTREYRRLFGQSPLKDIRALAKESNLDSRV